MSGPQLYPTRMKERVHQLYYIQRNPMPKVLETLKEEFPEFQKKNLIAVNGCGLGCTLIERKVIEKISFTYYPDLKGHSDIFFANEVWKNGMRVFVDTSVICDHRNVPWSEVKDR